MERLMLKRIGRGVWVMSSIFVTAYLIYVLLPLLYPFLLAWVIAYAMNPCVNLLQQSMKLPRWVAVSLSLLLYFGAALLILTAAVTRLVKELITLSQSFNLHIDAWMDWLTSWTQNDSFQNIVNEIGRFYQNNPNYHETINQNVTRTTQTIGTAVTDLVTGIFNGILQIIYYLPNLGTIFIVVLLSTFFLSNSWERHNRALFRMIPGVIHKPMTYIFSDLKKALFGFAKAQLILISITAFIVMITLYALGVNSAFAIGLLIGLVDLLPYLGVGIVLIPWSLYAFMSDDLTLGIGLTVLYSIILIVRQIMEPKVLASSVGLDPLAALFGMFVGLKLFGILGLIIGPVSLVIVDAFRRAHIIKDLRNYIIGGRVR
ncbi:sporulation integral membrane protein YtvI [Paenibacillus glucanolyticus]|uniref:sporulation integral membrane protein YtvI n=1 Tax=Paenibacillus glucanolyticus TaxID=59843 RepID=UPI00096E0A85|nr:sporulation integral membrane protein YtvI [Paenibacillus glucanolyticus]OMF74565.1 sporulation integral membrane protein YtvI [Paenibacillus glucanolyticus]